MKRDDYRRAAAVVEQHHREVLDELTRRILETEHADPVVGRDIDELLNSYSQKLWYITTCWEQLRQAGARESQPAQVAKIECSHNAVTDVLSAWLIQNQSAAILSISILDYADRLACIVVYRTCG